jgi:hypothetical protein
MPPSIKNHFVAAMFNMGNFTFQETFVSTETIVIVTAKTGGTVIGMW